MAENSNKRIQSQAALILNIHDILNQVGDKREYNNIFIAESDADNQFSHFSHTNRLTKTMSMLELFDIKPAQLSLLAPSIKLYKVFFTDESQKKQLSWQIPFDDYLGASEISEDTISTMLNRHIGKGNGVGIKSFEYNYEGTNQAEINSNISAKLSLFFSNIDDLVKIITIPTNDERYLESDNKSNIVRKFKYSDLVLQESRTIQDHQTGTKYNDNYYRIKVVCGYGHVTKSMLHEIGININRIDDLLKAIQDTKVILYLIPTLHELSYNEDGSVELTINYQAAIDSFMFSSELDIFRISDNYEKYITIRKKIQKLLELTSLKDKIRNDCTSDYQKSQIKIYEEKLEKIYNKLEEETKKEKKDLYTGIYTKLISDNKLYLASVNIKQLGIETGFFGTETEEADVNKIASLRNSVKQTIYVRKIIKNHWSFFSGDSAEVNSVLAENNVKQNILDIKNQGKLSQELSNFKLKVAAEVAPENEQITFLFLGDVIDIACNILNREDTFQNNHYDRPRIILGNMLIPKKPYLINNVAPDTKDAFESINLSDIPISLDIFSEFFNNRILSSNRDFYPLGAFIKDIVTDLIIPSLSPVAFGRTVETLTNRVSTYVFSYPMDENGLDQVTGLNYDEFGEVIQSNFESKIADSLNIEQQLGNQLLNYYFIYVSSQIKTGFLKDNEDFEEQNNKKGIFHFRIGTDSGIVKSITFTKNDHPYYREAVVLNEGSKDAIRLKQVYNADIVMFGNNIYRPGDFIYIEPDLYSVQLNEDNKTAGDVLGLGGYYMITKVGTQLNEYNFETKLQALYQASRKEAMFNGYKISDCSDDFIIDLNHGINREFGDLLNNIEEEINMKNRDSGIL